MKYLVLALGLFLVAACSGSITPSGIGGQIGSYPSDEYHH
jgi:hypothetical protein